MTWRFEGLIDALADKQRIIAESTALVQARTQPMRDLGKLSERWLAGTSRKRRLVNVLLQLISFVRDALEGEERSRHHGIQLRISTGVGKQPIRLTPA
jgi:hypothetical protein